ncbi:hypothetical protein JN01_0287 [Entomoplasma freundtii]|uniref:Uncharacterized protein n=1 Tax=Entomoplasma freundtii TaxID=74700 RepID=A0A2K8NR56_9MOLU|nr:hybrid sensor histidine kinase/response regulator [Entomoplasma freundtii]ATZ16299.1 hypothetical protein EFREU_v1c02730 [Entomoplasma freundtii]TDY56799.1 hypothetical protein JN01_0287 [Entomoplasma freundtii]
MKIDLHCHTKAIKSGELSSRDMPNDENSYNIFIKNRLSKNVLISAITNHNSFDLEQFNNLVEFSKGHILFLPGVEIDVLDSENISHNCNIIINPSKKEELSKYLNDNVSNVDKFCIDLDKFIDLIKMWKAITLISSSSKGENFPVKDINKIKQKSKDSFVYFLEASNRRSASIISNHDYPSFVGSDSQRWDDIDATNLPETEVEIKDFNSLRNFLSNNTLFGLNQKDLYQLSVLPKDQGKAWEYKIDLNLNSGVNIIVGPKASGKTILLRGIKEELEKKFAINPDFYEGKDDYYKIEKALIKNLTTNNLNISNEWNEVITNIKMASSINYSLILSNYKSFKKWILSQKTNKYKKISEIIDGPHAWNNQLEEQSRQEINEIIGDIQSIKNCENILVKYELDEEIRKDFNLIKLKVQEVLIQKAILLFILKFQKKLINGIKNNLKKMLTKKTDSVTKPSKLGIYDIWLGRINCKKAIDKLLNKNEKLNGEKFIGDVVSSDGSQEKIYIKVKSFLSTPSLCKKNRDQEFIVKPKNKAKTLLKKIADLDGEFFGNSFIELANVILENSKEISDANDLVSLIKEYVNQKGDYHKPSSGEEQFLALSNYLNDLNKQFYILDEPEKSLDNKLIVDYIVDKIKELEKNNKIILLITHNSNIAINTNPLNIIYREISKPYNKTYIGDSFSGQLRDVEKTSANIDWRQKSLDILEGGRKALNLRKEYYNVE